MRLIIAGSRSVSDMAVLERAFAVGLGLELVDAVTEVVSGGARGADRLGEEWARRNDVPVKRFPADWRAHGPRAGFLRNEEMIRYADGLLALWDGQSRGTRHVIGIARMVSQRRHFPVHVHRVSG